jgi:hypothetical protein
MSSGNRSFYGDSVVWMVLKSENDEVNRLFLGETVYVTGQVSAV